MNRIVDVNLKAQNLFGRSLWLAGGKSIENVWIEWPVIGKVLDSETLARLNLQLRNAGEQMGVVHL
jgi:hypothetical protein